MSGQLVTPALHSVIMLYRCSIYLYLILYTMSCYRDTLFLEDFQLSSFVSDFLSSRAKPEGGALVPCYRCKDEGNAYVLYVAMQLAASSPAGLLMREGGDE